VPELRRAVETGRPFITTRAAALWSLRAIAAARKAPVGVRGLQDWHRG